MRTGPDGRSYWATLEAAEITPSKLGPARRARLTGKERELYFWILRRFATRGRPSGAETRDEAERLGVEDALPALAREDLVHLGRDGEIAVAYPFSGRPTAHRVRFPSGHEAHAMCAIDALGVAPMFGEPIQIVSRDPHTHEEVLVRIAPEGDVDFHPESAVVVAGVEESCGESFRGCCPVLNFFASTDSAERWLDENAHARGEVVSMREAIAAGRAVFGDVFGDD